MQFVQLFQVSDCSDLQEIEIIFASVTKISDVTMEGGTPAIVLADIAVNDAPGFTALVEQAKAALAKTAAA